MDVRQAIQELPIGWQKIQSPQYILAAFWPKIHTKQNYFHKSLSIFSAVQHVATEVKSQIEDFRPYIPLIQGLRNPGMRSRHWELLSEELGFPIKPKQTLTFEKCLELGLQNHIDKIAKVAEVAGKEYSIEQVCLCGHMVVFTVL